MPIKRGMMDSNFERLTWDDSIWRGTREFYLEVENLPKDIWEENQHDEDRPTRAMLLEMISILDGMERLVSIAESEVLEENPVLKNWLTSILGLQRRMARSLEKVGVFPVPSLGRPFDPHIHEAVEIKPLDGFPPATVVEVQEKPYRWGNSIVRVGKVVVTPKGNSVS
ncbi:MAG: nucleotide exchange factor GrpE, partial [Candidatus Omnitrophica bacterium]|nr:nucleotide exchange factor GrpE [Candidatus Omnitrophota bacterium]